MGGMGFVGRVSVGMCGGGHEFCGGFWGRVCEGCNWEGVGLGCVGAYVWWGVYLGRPYKHAPSHPSHCALPCHQQEQQAVGLQGTHGLWQAESPSSMRSW